MNSVDPRTVNNYQGSVITFVSNNGDRADRVDFFFHAGASGYALMGTANDFGTACARPCAAAGPPGNQITFSCSIIGHEPTGAMAPIYYCVATDPQDWFEFAFT